MRDGVKLHTNVYLPTDKSDFPLPAILVRTPYGADFWDFHSSEVFCITDTHRYILVVQDTRGRFLSEGIDSVFLDDGWRDGKWDGYDAVEWIAEQEWCNGKVGMWGGSALGITQYLAAGACPPHLVCCFPIVASWNMYVDCTFPGGVFRKYDVEGWLEKQGSYYMKYYFAEHSRYDEEWQYLDVGTRKEQVSVPMFHIGGWHDFFLTGPPKAFSDLQYYGKGKARGNQKLLIGPWVHSVGTNKAGELTYPLNARVDFDSLFWRWFDYWLKDSLNNGMDEFPTVSYYLMGPVDEEGNWNYWKTADTFPPQAFGMKFYLHGGGRLDTLMPVTEEEPDTFVYDPKDPVPTLGENNLILERGPYDQTSLLSRPDVLVFSTDVIEEPIEVTGYVKLYLFASSNRLDTDFTLKLMDEYPDGRNMLILDGILRARYRNGFDHEELLTPGEVYEFVIEPGPTAYVFAPGHKIKIAISSSNYPKYDINPNTGEPFGKETDTLSAINVVYHDVNYPSYLLLPVTNRELEGVEEVVLSSTQVFSKKGFIYNPFLKNVDTKIYSVGGRRIMEKRLKPGDKMSLKNLPVGIYIALFVSEGKVLKKEKIIKVE